MERETKLICDIPKQNSSLVTLTLDEVGVMVKIRDVESIKRWLIKNNIEIHKFSRINYVYKIDVDCVIAKPFVLGLKLKYPNNWEQMFMKIAKDDFVYEMVLLSLGGEFIDKAMTKIKTKNAEEEALYKRYSS
ncbi:hypothetical protein [Flavobacterium sp. LB1P62]|uniref:hypothetical protein n=1 Tax=Flavobacterium sp. LB1P62 TaxID=3401715 RepID=UPI003AAC79C8